jgi:hypothetical protein
MLRRKNLVRKGIAVMTLAAAATLAMAGAQSAQAQSTGTTAVPDTQRINYFVGGNVPASAGGGKVNVTDPLEPNFSSQSNEICAMIYVFNAAQRLEECCGCPITQDGLLTLAVNGTGTVATTGSLNTNALNSGQNPLGSGVIRIVSAEPNGCDSLTAGLESGLCTSGGPLVNVCDATGGVFPSGQYLHFNPAYNGQHQFVGKGDSSLDLVPNLRAWGTHIQNGALTESEYAHNPITQNDANSLAEACGDIQKNGSTGVCTCGIGDSNLLFP